MESSSRMIGGQIKEKIKVFLKNNFLISTDFDAVNDDDSFLEKGIIDSTGVLELVSFIEETFQIKVEDEELIPQNLDSLNNVTLFIARKKTNAS